MVKDSAGLVKSPSVTSNLVFPEPAHERLNWLAAGEPQVNWYLECSHPEAQRGRQQINDWYEKFNDPDGHFRARLRSQVDEEHSGAIDELFIYDRLSTRFLVTYEEDNVGPDFRLYGDGVLVGSVEVFSLFMRSDWAAEQRREHIITRALNDNIQLQSWFLRFEIVNWSNSPSTNSIVTWTRQQIASLPAPETVGTRLAEAPHATYQDRAVTLNFTFIPRRATKPPAATDRIVGVGGIIGGFGNSQGRLRRALDKKAGGRYDLRGAPFAITVGVHDPFCSVDDVEGALYGSERVIVNIGDGSVTPNLGLDGFFSPSRKFARGKNTRVSDVYGLLPWSPWDPEDARFIRLENPFAERPFGTSVLPVIAGIGVTNADERGLTLGWVPERPHF